LISQPGFAAKPKARGDKLPHTKANWQKYKLNNIQKAIDFYLNYVININNNRAKDQW